jgi:hypothetical protein
MRRLPVLILIFCGGAAFAQPKLTFTRERVLASGSDPRSADIRITPLTRSGPGPRFRQVFTQPTGAPIRLHFEVLTEVGSSEWEIRLKEPDPGSRVLWTQTSAANRKTFWSTLVPNNSVIELYTAAPRNQLALRVDRYAVEGIRVKPQAITPPDQMKSMVGQPQQFRDWGRSVARIRFIGDDGRTYYCSGFLIASDLVMTNEHCMRSDLEVESAEADFDYDAEDSKILTIGVKKRELVDVALDLGVFRLVSTVDRPALQMAAADPVEKQALLIIQHPGGEPKKISQEDCRVQGTNIAGAGGGLTDFGHLCDTLGGSSGSPVIDLGSGTVIGLHHLAFSTDAAALVNQAVRMNLIVSKIKQQNPGLLK